MSLIIPRQYPGFSQLLFKLIGANMNVTTDQIFSYVGNESRGLQYLITDIRVLNASISLDTAAGGVYNAITKPAGGILVAAAQAYSTLTGSTLGLELTRTALANGVQSATPYLSLTTAQGAAATADILLFGRILTGVY
jgi:hypothetical protein